MFERQSTAILAIAVLAAALGGWLQRESQHAHVPNGVNVAQVGDIRPDLSLKDLDGKTHHLADFKGRRVLLNFWASWCVPCTTEMPALNRMQSKFGEKGGIVLGIAMDDPPQARAFLTTHPVSYPILIGRLESPSTSLQWGDTDEVLPYSVLLDGDGKILAMRRGPLDDATLARWLDASTAP